MALHGERVHPHKKIQLTEVEESGLNKKQNSGETYESAETGRYVTATSTRSPSESRTITPEPSETTVSTSVSEDSGYDPRNTNLDYFHSEAQFDQRISEGQFTKVKGLSDCCRSDGKVELHCWSKVSHLEGLTVVVKRVVMSRVGANIGKERNERIVFRGHCQRHAEDCLNEVGVYCYLARQHDLPQYILKMHTAFQATGDVWMVLEHANDGDLFAVAQKLKRDGGSLSSSQLKTWTWQLLQAVRYLHRHAIGHRDISMENVLLCNGSVRLMDFGQSVRTHSIEGVLLRYFNALGKPYYRPPECHCPMQSSVDVQVPAGARPGEVSFVQTATGDALCEVLLPSMAVPGQICTAEPWGYAVAPVDVFACGVCIFIMATGMPPWRQANLRDPHFAWVHQCGISQLVKAWKKVMPPAADELMAAMVQSDPTRRPSSEQCLSHRWFDELSSTAVPIHHMCCADSTPHTDATRTEAQLDTIHMSPLQFPATPNDPYREDAVVRSAAMPQMPCSAAAFGGILSGDFYHLPEDTVVRSAGPTPEELTLQRFSAGSQPPKVPTSESFALEPTTFSSTSSDPSELANNILDVLTMACGAVVKKINSNKFAIKAEVSDDNGACTLKVRIYKQAADKYAIEFQRRGGESTVLHKIFDQVSSHFATPTKAPRCTQEKNTDAILEICKSGAQLPCLPWLAGGHCTTSPPPTRSCTAPALNQRSHARPGQTRRHSVPALTTRGNTALKGNSKIAMADMLQNVISERTDAVGSGLNAVRMRSKSSLRRSPNTLLSAPLQLNATM